MIGYRCKRFPLGSSLCWLFQKNKLLFAGLFSLVFFSSCSNLFNFKDQSSTAVLQSEGNGKTYDGKIRIVHNYDPDIKLLCNNQQIPNTVLFRKTESNDSWYLIKNLDNCRQEEPKPIENVSYDDVSKVATYNGLTYYPPKILKVSSSEDPNLPDINPYDGLCLDANGLCSLRAATEQSSYISATTEVSVSIEKGTYKLNHFLQIDFSTLGSGHQIYLIGEDRNNTILDAQGLSQHLRITGQSSSLNISNLTFKNGSTKEAFSSSSIHPYFFGGLLNIENCLFQYNSGNPVIYAGSGNLGLQIRKSVFTDNSTKTNEGTLSTFGTPVLLEDSMILNGSGYGFEVRNKTQEVLIRNSTIANNQSLAVSYYQCLNCSIENSTIFGNKYGILLSSTLYSYFGNQLDLSIKNSTIVNNGDADFGNIHFLQEPGNKLNIFNSVVSNNNSSRPNCTYGGSTQTVVATHSLIDDSSCVLVGSGNKVGLNPLLGVLSDNGGYTYTILPGAGSPLIDSGDNATCTNMDQRGASRKNICDIGAVEVQ